MDAARTALAPEAAAAVVPRRAATTLVVRDGDGGLEVLMVRRSPTAAFMPGSYVFPGGALDAADGAPDTLAACDEGAAALAARLGPVTGLGEAACAYAVAALRECFEECGLWLGAADEPACGWAALRARLHGGEPLVALAAAAALPLCTGALQPWSRWLTPVGLPRRFDTLFFVAAAPTGQQPTADAGETTALTWVQPAAALAAQRRGAFPMEFATVQTVASLEPYGDASALLRQGAQRRPITITEPRLQLDDQRRIVGVTLG